MFIQIRLHRMHMFFDLPDPDLLLLLSYYFVTLFECLSLKNNGYVPSKSKKLEKLC
jgi:hypothetical protein